MKKRIIACIICGVFVTFMSVGYASLSDELEIYGFLGANTQERVFIVDAETVSGSASVNNFTSSALNSTVDLKNENVARIEITVFNNASETYGFNAVKFVEGMETYDNQEIKYTLIDLERKQEIESKTYLKFFVEFSYVEGASFNNSVLNSILNFEFLPIDELADDDSEIAANDVQDRFKEILNTEVEHDQLIDQLNDAWNNGRWFDTSYIGNVVGASKEDKELIESLFAGNLVLNINGTPTEVKIMIKRENIDGNRRTGDSSGREMTVYMTTDPLTDSGAPALVYCSVYTKNQNATEWERIGNMFEGTCTILDYSGSEGTGSFNTDTWRSTDSNGQEKNQTITQMIS